MSDDNPQLTAALRALAEDEQRLGVSDEVAARVCAEFKAVSAAGRKARTRRNARYAMAFAAAAAVVAAVAVPWRLPNRAGVSSEGAQTQTSLAAREIVTDFMPLTYSGVPMTEGHLVRLQVPRTALASFGLTPPDAAGASSTDTVLADVVVGDDGLARAVRFVRTGP